MWTRFMDMHSGGGQKLKWAYIYIEAAEEEARSVFYAKFGRNPARVTCTCCGEDYVTSSEESLQQLTAYDRKCCYVYENAAGKRIVWSDYVNHADKKTFKGRWIEFQGTDALRQTPSSEPAMSLEEYFAQESVLKVPAAEISDEERKADVPEEGFVWR